MKWKKLGKIFCPDGKISWMRSHASVPIAEHIEGDFFRIYFSARDLMNRSYTGYVLIDINNPFFIEDVSTNPVLFPGELGEFDDSGAMATWLVKTDNKNFLYYIGWNLGVTVPFRNSIGLAYKNDAGRYIRYCPGPIMDRSMQEPHFCASCSVILHEDLWHMWYLSCTDWYIQESIPQHRYHIKYAYSFDGIHWVRKGHVSIDYSNDEESAISRPSVLNENGLWKMWFSYRGRSYRIGYAESHDGKNWTRKDHLAGIDVSKDGWDSEMIEYPFVFDHKGERFMLYNGNGYGKTGFGLAVLEND
ncbi:glycoside hydrolase family protein [Desulfotignum phosphitoxidans]|uniref:Glycosyl hydrolase family 32 N-terminal domain-containing protein n=1 Tax=Desulfotignum phosphitoxidans DSM 13687 TaxID=1286635 RepID=S0FRD7_9BACT|nr:hypothetical protein [Desulfotignum phosphitoxidans]EMS77643.1 hypothetical protein Dpo_13c00410 [Desulfotignum phosphitoxidans DSM 13687]